jgi:hypothetical protein
MAITEAQDGPNQTGPARVGAPGFRLLFRKSDLTPSPISSSVENQVHSDSRRRLRFGFLGFRFSDFVCLFTELF